MLSESVLACWFSLDFKLNRMGKGGSWDCRDHLPAQGWESADAVLSVGLPHVCKEEGCAG